MTTSHAKLRAAQAKFRDCVNSINDGVTGSAKKGTDGRDEILVPLTSSLYVKGRLTDREKVLVDVGTGFYVEKVWLEKTGRAISECVWTFADWSFCLVQTAEKAIAFYNDKVKGLDENLQELEKIVQGKSQQLRIVEEGEFLLGHGCFPISRPKYRIDMIFANLLQSFGRRCSVARPWRRSPLERLLDKYCRRFVLKMSRYQKVICHINPELRCRSNLIGASKFMSRPLKVPFHRHEVVHTIRPQVIAKRITPVRPDRSLIEENSCQKVSRSRVRGYSEHGRSHRID